MGLFTLFRNRTVRPNRHARRKAQSLTRHKSDAVQAFAGLENLEPRVLMSADVFADPVRDAQPAAAVVVEQQTDPSTLEAINAAISSFDPTVSLAGGQAWGAGARTTAIAFGDVDGDGRDEVGIARKNTVNARYWILDDEQAGYAVLLAGGQSWTPGQFATGIAFGDVDGDGIDEVGVTRKAGSGARYWVLDDANAGFGTLRAGGQGWGTGAFATAIAFGDTDGDGRDEVGVARKNSVNARYWVLDDSVAGFGALLVGGQSWAPTEFATSIAFGNTDLDGRDEVGVTRKSSSGARYFVLNDANAGFNILRTGGQGWGSGAFATSIAFGDTDGDGRDEVGVARKNNSNARYFIFDDSFGGFGRLRAGGNGWASDAYATSIAFGDVDGDGREEVGVTRKASGGQRFLVVDDDDANYVTLFAAGHNWGSTAFATSIAFGDVDGDGHDDFGVGRKASSNARYWVYNSNDTPPPAPVPFLEDFEGGLGDFDIDNTFGSGGGLWHVSTGRGGDPGHSPFTSLYYGHFEGPFGGGDYDTGSPNGGAVFSPTFQIPATGIYELSFNHFLDTEGTFDIFDIAEVAVDAGFGFVPILSTFDGTLDETFGVWETVTADLSAYAGQDIVLRFSFDTVDSVANFHEGWYIDDIAIEEVIELTPYVEDFEGGLGKFVIDNTFGSGGGLWHVSTGRGGDLNHSPFTSLYYGQGEGAFGGGNYDTGFANGGAVFSPTIRIPATGVYELSFNYFLETEGSSFFDIAEVAIDGGSGFDTLLTSANGSLDETFGLWDTVTADLSAYAGQDVILRFSFDTGDSVANANEGWYIDDIAITEFVPLAEDFEGGLGVFSIDNTFGSGGGLWHLSTGRELDPGHSPFTSLYYGQFEGPFGGGDYDTGAANGGAVTSSTIHLPATEVYELSFNYLLDTEGQSSFYDIAEVAIDDGFGFVTLLTSADGSLAQTGGSFVTVTADLSAYAGQDITLRFSFDTGDSISNFHEGWYIDDIAITSV